MKNILTIILMSTLMLAFVACKKSEQETYEKEKPSLKNFLKSGGLPNIDSDGLVFFEQSKLGNSSTASIYVNGGFHHQTGAGFNNGTLTVENINIPFDGNNSYIMETNDSLQPSFSSVWGSNLDIALSNGANNFTLSLPVPASIGLTMNLPNGTSTQLSKASGIPVTWNSDASNLDKVYIKVTYHPSITISYLNSSAPSTPVTLFFDVNDNGSYTLSPSEIALLPTDAFIEIDVYRGNIDLVTVGNVNYDILAYSTSHVMFTLVP